MRLPEIAIKNKRFTLIVITLLLALGVYSFLTMPRLEAPPVNVSISTVIAIYPGATTEDIESLIVDPLEEAINELEDLEAISTNIFTGLAIIAIEFDLSTDPEDKFREVKDAVNNTRDKLPAGLHDIQFNKYTTSNVNIYQFSLVSEVSGNIELRNEAERLKQLLEGVDEIKKIELFGEKNDEVHVYIDIEKMSQLNISINQIEQILSSTNLNIPAGSANTDKLNLVINSSGNYKSLNEIRNTPISFYSGHLIYLKDIATVTKSFKDDEYVTKQNGENAIFVVASQKENTNIFDIRDEVARIIPEFEKELPSGIKLNCVFNQADGVRRRVDDFLVNLLIGILIVGLTIFFALGIRAASIVMTAVPLSIFIGIALVDLTGFALQQISIAGLVIALGLLVDNAIVVTENITNFLAQGYSKWEAAIKGTKEVGWPIVTSTITTLFAFIPLIMMGNQAGQFIQSLPITVIFTLSASLLIALAITPLLSKNTLKIRQAAKPAIVFTFLVKSYRKTLEIALKFKYSVLSILLLVFIASCSLLFKGYINISFFPISDNQQFLINIETPQGSNLKSTEKVVSYVENILDTIPEIANYSSNIGQGNPKIFMAQQSVHRQLNKGQIMVTTYDLAYDKYVGFQESLNLLLAKYQDAKIEVKSFVIGPPVESPIKIVVTGSDYQQINAIAENIEKVMNNTSGTINVTNNSGESNLILDIDINQEKASTYGLQTVEIDKTIRTCFEGAKITEYLDPYGNNIPVTIKLRPEDGSQNLNIKDFERIQVKSMNNHFIPLHQVADVKLSSRNSELSHYNSQKSVTITSNIIKGYNLDKIMDGLSHQIQLMDIPGNCQVIFDGEIKKRNETYGRMVQAALISIILILSVMVLQFKSLRQPLIIFSAMPLAMIGSLWALFITGNPFSFTALLGFISLIGIVVNNSIILIDFINKLISQGNSVQSALISAGEKRFRPIVLTTLTTIGGLLPLTLFGGMLWSPMGWVIIGGMSISTFLVLIIVPVLYATLYSNIKVAR